jgi:tetratricopeptide (TPR) repeat protein
MFDNRVFSQVLKILSNLILQIFHQFDCSKNSIQFNQILQSLGWQLVDQFVSTLVETPSLIEQISDSFISCAAEVFPDLPSVCDLILIRSLQHLTPSSSSLSEFRDRMLETLRSEVSPSNIALWYQFSLLSIQLADFPNSLDCIRLANKALEKFSVADVRLQSWRDLLRFVSAKAFFGLKNFQKCTNFLKSALNSESLNATVKLEATVLLGECQLAISNTSEASRTASQVLQIHSNNDWALSTLAWCSLVQSFPSFESGLAASSNISSLIVHQIFSSTPFDDSCRSSILQDACATFKKCTELNPTSHIHHFRLGRTYLFLNGQYALDKSFAFSQLISAAKLCPSDHDIYAFLGHYYLSVEKNVISAVRCYRKSLELNCDCQNSGCALFAFLIAQNKRVDAENICLSALSVSPNSLWANILLSRMKKESGDHQAAISHLQFALRSAPNDSILWASISDSYFSLKKFIPALKSATRALELQPNFLQARNIKLLASALLGNFQDAVHFHELACKENVHFSSSFSFSMAESFFKKSSEFYQSGEFHSASVYIDIAVQYSENCIKSRSSCAPSASTFLLHGQILLFRHQIQSISCRHSASVASAQSAKRAFCKSAFVLPSSSESWFNIAVTASRDRLSARDGPRHFGIHSNLCAILLDPLRSEFWNLLATILSSQWNTQQQHCFFKAASLKFKSLGTFCLYMLQNSQHLLASELIRFLQQQDPSDPTVWLALGFYHLGFHSVESNQNSLSSFMQSLELNANPSFVYQGLGLANLNLGRFSEAIFYLDKIHESSAHDANLSVALALSLEKHKQFRRSEQILQHVLSHSNSDKTIIQLASQNLARVLAFSENFHDALQVSQHAGYQVSTTIPASIHLHPDVLTAIPQCSCRDSVCCAGPLIFRSPLCASILLEANMWKLTSFSLFKTGNSEGAKKSCFQAIHLNTVNLTAIAQQRSSINESAELLNYLVHFRLEIILMLSQILISCGDITALDIIDQALSQFPSNLRLLLTRFSISLSLNDAVHIRKSLELIKVACILDASAISMSSFYSADAHFQLFMKHHNIAKRQLAKTVFSDPASAVARRQVSSFLLNFSPWASKVQVNNAFELIDGLVDSSSCDQNISISELICRSQLLSGLIRKSDFAKLCYRNPESSSSWFLFNNALDSLSLSTCSVELRDSASKQMNSTLFQKFSASSMAVNRRTPSEMDGLLFDAASSSRSIKSWFNLSEHHSLNQNWNLALGSFDTANTLLSSDPSADHNSLHFALHKLNLLQISRQSSKIPEVLAAINGVFPDSIPVLALQALSMRRLRKWNLVLELSSRCLALILTARNAVAKSDSSVRDLQFTSLSFLEAICLQSQALAYFFKSKDSQLAISLLTDAWHAHLSSSTAFWMSQVMQHQSCTVSDRLTRSRRWSQKAKFLAPID